jgi:hypothetical protein
VVAAFGAHAVTVTGPWSPAVDEGECGDSLFIDATFSDIMTDIN